MSSVSDARSANSNGGVMKPKTERTLLLPSPFENVSIEVRCEFVGPYPQPLFCALCGRRLKSNPQDAIWHCNDDPE